MSSLPRRLTQLLGSLVLCILLVSCTEHANAPSSSALKPGGPSMGYAPPHGCTNVAPGTPCVGTAATQDVTIEQLRVCKVYPGGSGPDVEIKLNADYVQFQDGPQSGTYTLHAGECKTLWRNGEEVNGVRSADVITVSEIPVPGYTSTSQVSTIIRDQANPAGPGDPASTFTTTVGPVTSATTITSNVGGNRVPGALVVFINTPIPTNGQPTPFANGPYTQVEGSPVTFSSTGTTDPEGDPLSYLWDFGDGITSTSQNPVHTYVDNGIYPVTLTVDDGHGPRTATTSATISNVNPVPSASVANASLACGELAQFTGAFTDAGIIDQTWTWSINWGDGSANTTGGNATMSAPITATHDYGTNTGPKTITLTVTDKDGGVGTATTTETNNCQPNRQPVPQVNGPYTQVEGSAVTFNTTGTSDPDGDALTYSWTFGDGGTGTGPAPTHVYADNGVYPVTLTVSDGHTPPVTVTTTSTITNLAPVPAASITATVACGQLATFSGSFTDAGVIDHAWTWTIAWGDGSPNTTGSNALMATPISATHAYASNGTFTVTLTVTDKDGGTGTATTSVTRNCAPVAASCVSITAIKGVPITNKTIVATGGNGAPYTFTATGLPAGLSISSGGTISGTPTVTGTFPYVVTIKDKDGNAGTLNCSVVVGATPTATCVTINAIKGKAITAVSLTGTGGSGGPYTFTATGLPAGLTMSASGTISGTPTAGGTFTYTVTIRDKDGNQGSFTCTITVSVPDTTAPVCSVYANASPPYMSYQDVGSGIVRLEVTTNLNRNYKVTVSPAPAGMTISGGQANGSAFSTGTIITFPSGQTSLFKVSAVRVQSGVASQLTVKAVDAGGYTVTCDPIETTVTRLKQDNGVQTFTGVPYEEHFVTIENGGLKSLEIEVNGTTFKVKRLSDDEVRVVDIGSAMRRGNNNTITLTPKGKKGETADITIGPEGP